MLKDRSVSTANDLKKTVWFTQT